MSEYTTQVRFICENFAGLTESVGFTNVDNVLENSWDKVFTTNVNVFDEAYRKVLCKKILKHYYTREIGEEVTGLWLLRMNTRFEEIMPFYNQLYNSTLIKFNPLYDTDLTKDYQKKSDTKKHDKNSLTETDEKTSSENITANEDFNSAKTNSTTSNTDENYSKNNDNIVNITGNKNVNENGSVNVDESKNNTGNKNISESGNYSKSGSENNNGENWDMYSDTPQGSITDLRAEKYLTNARHLTNTDSKTYTESGTDSKSSTETHGDNDTLNSETLKTNTTSETYSENKVDDLNEVSKRDVDVTSNLNENVINSKDNTSDKDFNENVNISKNENNKSKINSLEDYIEHIVGKSSGASFSKMLLEFRETFLNIDLRVIEEFSDLFINLW